MMHGERKVLRLSAKRAGDFLQGLVTADLRFMQPGQFCFSALLGSNGRFVCDFFLHKASDVEFLVDIHRGFASEFVKAIKYYDLFGEVNLIETDLVVNVTSDFLPALKNGVFFGRTIGGKGDLEYGDYHLERIKLEIADGFYDLEPGRSIILEYGYEGLGAVSFTKGCYVGQELITRTKMLGALRKKVFTVRGVEGVPKGTALVQAGKEVGVLLSGVLGFYLALLRFEALSGDDFEGGFKVYKEF